MMSCDPRKRISSMAFSVHPPPAEPWIRRALTRSRCHGPRYVPAGGSPRGSRSCQLTDRVCTPLRCASAFHVFAIGDLLSMLIMQAIFSGLLSYRAVILGRQELAPVL